MQRVMVMTGTTKARPTTMATITTKIVDVIQMVVMTEGGKEDEDGNVVDLFHPSSTISFFKYARNIDMVPIIAGFSSPTTNPMRRVSMSPMVLTPTGTPTRVPLTKITGNLKKLMIWIYIMARDKIDTENGVGMNISLIGHSRIQTPNCNLHLNNTLHVPIATKNLLPVHKLPLDNNDAFLENFLQMVVTF
jgi:hypothetical protein